MSPSPPDDAAWWDQGATLAAVLHQLRLQSGDVDDTRVSALIPAAGYLINTYLDRCDAAPGPPANPVLQEALQRQTIVLYGRQDPTSTFVPAPSPSPTGLDPEVQAMIEPFRQRVGAA